jgi:hypothetical protein
MQAKSGNADSADAPPMAADESMNVLGLRLT